MQYDPHKNQINIKKHNIFIPELATIFDNPFYYPDMDYEDPEHSEDEKRYIAYGWTTTGGYVMIWYTYREGEIRIIGGRKLK